MKETTTERFHPGEQRLQDEYGSRESLARNGQRLIQPFLTQQHQDFFQTLPYVAFACEDEQGRLKPTLFCGQPGFIRIVETNKIMIDADPHEELFTHQLRLGDHIGILGIDFTNRRRNRINGRISQLKENTLYIDVDQAYGNCHKYIQQRHLIHNNSHAEKQPQRTVQHGERLNKRLQEMITMADTCFITSRSLSSSVSDRIAETAHGIDISHRGGQPGFIHVIDDKTLCLPDYPGNRFFNTLGNLLEDPTAGLLIIDFETGHTLQLTGTCDIDFGPAQDNWPAGAERLLMFNLEEAQFRENALPLHWRFDEYSPYLSFTKS